MARKSQLTTQACVILPLAVVSFGLGYIASSRRRRKTIADDRDLFDDIDGDLARDVVQMQTPHPAWTPGQKQPHPEGLDGGTDALVVIVCTRCADSVHVCTLSRPGIYE